MKSGIQQKLGFRFGPLSVLAVLLVASSVLRFVGGPAAAVAKEVVLAGVDGRNPNASEQCEPTPDLAVVLEALSEREARVQEREAYVAKRSIDLAAAETKIERQLEKLKAAEEQLDATLDIAATAAEDDVARLTAVYENMKPKEAARLFEAMSPEFAAGFLGRMRPDAAAKVIEGLSPDIAYSISAVLAGRHADIKRPTGSQSVP